MKKAQLSVPFQWIYVLIAGAAILVLFITFVARQKDSSEEQLSIEVTQKLESIFTLTAQSTKTFNPQKMSAADMHFTCDKDDVSQYWIGRSSPESLDTIAIFSSSRIPVEKQLDTWTWPFDMPFSVMNPLFLSSPTITSFIVYDSNDPFWELIEQKLDSDFPEEFNFIKIEKSDFEREQEYALSTPHVRIIYFTDFQQLPSRIQQMPDSNVIIVKVEGERSVTYYKKQGNQVVIDDTVTVIQTEEDPNPAFYGALFSQDAEYYKCTMRKILKRMTILAELHQLRASEMKNEYERNENRACEVLIDPLVFKRLKDATENCDLSHACITEIEQASEHITQRSRVIMSQGCESLW